jgi:hypothetical protein
VAEGGGKEGRLKLSSIATSARSQSASRHWGTGRPTAYTRPLSWSVLAAFPRELLTNGSRAISVGTEDINRERAELETALPRCVIIHAEQFVYFRLALEKGGCLAALRESDRISGRQRGREQKRASIPGLCNARYNIAVKNCRLPVCSSAFIFVRCRNVEVSRGSFLKHLVATWSYVLAYALFDEGESYMYVCK